MRFTNLTLCVLLPATIASAQVVATAPLVDATVLAGATVAPGIAPGSNVWAGLARSATGAASGASLGLTHQIDPVQVDLQWQLNCHAISNSTSAAEIEVRYEITSAYLQSGNLIIDWQPTVTGTGQATLSVDVFDDGYVDAQGSAIVPVAFQNPFALNLRVTAGTNAQAGTFQGPWGSSWSWSGAAAAQLHIRFVPTHAQTTTLATQPCSPAPTLTVLPDLSQGLDLQAMAPPTEQLALFALGFQATNMPLPLSHSCLLLVDPAVILAQPLQPGMPAHQSLTIPTAARPATFLTQLITLNPTSATLTASPLLNTNIQ